VRTSLCAMTARNQNRGMTTYGMTAPGLLRDVQLLQRCCYWRKEAARGIATARVKAHAYEAEIVRRMDVETTICGTLNWTPMQRRGFWRFW